MDGARKNNGIKQLKGLPPVRHRKQTLELDF